MAGANKRGDSDWDMYKSDLDTYTFPIISSDRLPSLIWMPVWDVGSDIMVGDLAKLVCRWDTNTSESAVQRAHDYFSRLAIAVAVRRRPAGLSEALLLSLEGRELALRVSGPGDSTRGDLSLSDDGEPVLVLFGYADGLDCAARLTRDEAADIQWARRKLEVRSSRAKRPKRRSKKAPRAKDVQIGVIHQNGNSPASEE